MIKFPPAFSRRRRPSPAERAALASLCLILTAGTAGAFRPYSKGAEARTSWMTVSSIKTGQEYYMEVAADGAVLTRTETRKEITTRRGTIKPQLARDFFREIETSEVITSQTARDSKMVFYRGEVLKISAYISGELKRIDAPLNNFGEAFSYAFGEVKKAAAKLPVEKALKGFLTAEPFEGAALEELRGKASEEGGFKTLETYEIQKAPALLKAIKQPHRLIPLENDADVKHVTDFIASHAVHGLRNLFYIPSTRGTFKCQILEAVK